MSSTDAGMGYYAPKISDRESTGFDYFDKEVVENNFQRSEYVAIKPLNAINTGPTIFEIGHELSKFLVPLNSIEGRLKLKITKADGSALVAGDDDGASLINFFATSLFENVNCTLQGVKISDHSRRHQFKAAMLNLFSYGTNAKKYNLAVERFKTDTNVTSTDVNPACENWVAKKTLVNRSGVFYANFLPLIDLASGNNFLCIGHKLVVEFERGKSGFVILKKNTGTIDYNVEILDFELLIKKLYPNTTFLSNLEKKLEKNPAHYNFTRNIIRTYQTHSGVMRVDWHNIFLGQMPTALYFIFLDNEQVANSDKKNPHVWLPYGCKKAHLVVNGYNHPANSIEFDTDTGHIYDGFRWFLNNMGLRMSNEDIEIDPEKLYSDKFCIPFDLSHRSDNGFSPQAKETGSISFHCEFKEALASAITVMVMASFDSHVWVDQNNDVHTDYST